MTHTSTHITEAKGLNGTSDYAKRLHNDLVRLERAQADTQVSKAGSNKPSWLQNKYAVDADTRQRMAIAVAWKSKSTQSIRHDQALRAEHMGDIIQAAMLGAYEPPTLRDSEAVWFRKYRNESGEVVTELRESVQKLTPEQVQEKIQYKHIERVVRREVRRVLDLHGKVVPLNLEVEADDDGEHITAKRVYDEYLRDCEGTEFDRLDLLLDYTCHLLPASTGNLLRKLAQGEAKLSDIGSKSRTHIRHAVLEALHMADCEYDTIVRA